MAEVGGKRGDNVWCMGEYIVWGENDSEVHPSFRVHHVNSLHVTVGTCQALTSCDWLSSPHCGKQFAGDLPEYAGYRWELLPSKMEIVNSNTMISYQTKLSTGAHDPIGKSM